MTDLEALKEVLEYNAINGQFYWKIKANHKSSAGSIAGYLHKKTGYVRVTYNKNTYRAHRLAWAFVTGFWPEKEIDHIDGNRSNNKLENLRQATPQQNSFNRKRRSDNSSGVKGVYFMPKRNKWAAAVWVGSKRFYLGSFVTLEEATTIVVKERERLHKAFANNG